MTPETNKTSPALTQGEVLFLNKEIAGINQENAHIITVIISRNPFENTTIILYFIKDVLNGRYRSLRIIIT